MTEKASEIAKNLLWGLCALTLTICSIIVTRDLHSALKQVNQTLGRVDAAAKKQIENLESPAYQASLKASVDLGATLKGSVLQWNKQGIPERMARVLDSSDRTISALNETAAASRDLIRASDSRLNGDNGLFLELTSTVRKVSGQSDQVVREVTTLLSSTNLAVQDLTEVERAALEILKDPNITKTLGNIEAATKNIEGSTERLNAIEDQLLEAAKYSPKLMALIEKWGRTSVAWQKWIILVRIASIITGPFLEPPAHL